MIFEWVSKLVRMEKSNRNKDRFEIDFSLTVVPRVKHVKYKLNVNFGENSIMADNNLDIRTKVSFEVTR